MACGSACSGAAPSGVWLPHDNRVAEEGLLCARLQAAQERAAQAEQRLARCDAAAWAQLQADAAAAEYRGNAEAAGLKEQLVRAEAMAREQEGHLQNLLQRKSCQMAWLEETSELERRIAEVPVRTSELLSARFQERGHEAVAVRELEAICTELQAENQGLEAQVCESEERAARGFVLPDEHASLRAELQEAEVWAAEISELARSNAEIRRHFKHAAVVEKGPTFGDVDPDHPKTFIYGGAAFRAWKSPGRTPGPAARDLASGGQRASGSPSRLRPGRRAEEKEANPEGDEDRADREEPKAGARTDAAPKNARLMRRTITGSALSPEFVAASEKLRSLRAAKKDSKGSLPRPRDAGPADASAGASRVARGSVKVPGVAGSRPAAAKVAFAPDDQEAARDLYLASRLSSPDNGE